MLVQAVSGRSLELDLRVHCPALAACGRVISPADLPSTPSTSSPTGSPQRTETRSTPTQSPDVPWERPAGSRFRQVLAPPNSRLSGAQRRPRIDLPSARTKHRSRPTVESTISLPGAVGVRHETPSASLRGGSVRQAFNTACWTKRGLQTAQFSPRDVEVPGVGVLDIRLQRTMPIGVVAHTALSAALEDETQHEIGAVSRGKMIHWLGFRQPPRGYGESKIHKTRENLAQRPLRV